jgi:glycerophosphoryl diester phosphodiesterase
MNYTQVKYFIILISIILFSCEKQAKYEVNNLNNNRISVLGHGGMGIGSTYPINSFESILACLNSGADGTEIDVQITKDGKLVIYKDFELDGQSDCSGQVNQTNWEDMKECRFVTQPHLTYKIVSVEEVFDQIENLQNYTFTFDCKLYPTVNKDSYYATFADELARIIEKYQLKENIFIESQNPAFLKMLQERDKDYKLFIYPESFNEGIRISTEMGLYGITISTMAITKAQISEAHKKGFFVAIWNTHNKQRNVDAILKNPDFIQTDKVAHMIKLLKS